MAVSGHKQWRGLEGRDGEKSKRHRLLQYSRDYEKVISVPFEVAQAREGQMLVGPGNLYRLESATHRKVKLTGFNLLTSSL